MSTKTDNTHSGFECPTIGEPVPDGYRIVMVDGKWVMQKVEE